MDAEEYEYDGEAPRFWFSSRFGLAVLGFVGFLSISSQRTCMRVAIVCMINQTASVVANDGPASSAAAAAAAGDSDARRGYLRLNGSESGGSGQDGAGAGKKTCVGVPEFLLINSSEFFHQLNNGEFAWSSSRQNVVHDTFYWGFIVAHVPAGWLALRFGGKRVFGGFLLAGSVCTALIPIASRTHFYLLLVLRFLGGVGSGGAFPAMHTLWGKWAPPLERSLLASITYAGSLTGSVFIYPVAGLLCKYGFDGKGFDGGWPSIFYIFGALGIVWFVLWIVFASESPADHGRINEEERIYIEETLMSETTTSLRQNRLSIPWSKILTSFPFAAIVLCNFTYEWGVYTFEKLFDKYMKEVLHLEMRWNDGFTVLPYFGLWFLVMASGGAADRLQSHGVLNTGTTRKVMQVIGTVVPAGMVAAMGFIDCSQWKGPISFLTIGLSFCGFQYNGFLVNHLDIAPRYAGILMGIASAIGSTASFLGPFLFNFITDVTQDETERWQTMFLLTSTFYLFSMLFFLVCGSGKLQDWAVRDPRDPTDNLIDTQSSFPHHDPLDPGKTPFYAKELSAMSSPSVISGYQGKIPDVYPVDTIRRSAEEAEMKVLRALQQQQQQQQHAGSLPRGNVGAVLGQNHLSPPGNQYQNEEDEDEEDAVDRTNSSRSNDSKKEPNPHRTDHERSHRTGRGDRGGGGARGYDRRGPDGEPRAPRTAGAAAKRTLKTGVSRPADESLEIYESLSESPV